MRGTAKINYKPYLPPIFFGAEEKPYICRLAPSEFGFEFEWFDKFSTAVHTLHYKKRGSKTEESIVIYDSVISVDNLDTNCDSEFYIESEDGRRSNVRLVRTGAIPSETTVINYLHPEDAQYDFSGSHIASPSIVRTSTGRLVVTMDLFGHATAQNLTLLFYSDDDGKTWHYLTDLYPFFWSCVFYYRNVLYVLGFTTEYGDLRIACSKDDGETWSEAVTLFHGSNRSCGYGGMHRAPMHFISYNGRLYTSCEYGCWATSHLPGILSIDENDDLMVPENWTCSDFLPFDGEWKKAAGKQGDSIEGNIVVAPDGNLYNIMRWETAYETMVVESVDAVNLKITNRYKFEGCLSDIDLDDKSEAYRDYKEDYTADVLVIYDDVSSNYNIKSVDTGINVLDKVIETITEDNEPAYIVYVMENGEKKQYYTKDTDIIDSVYKTYTPTRGDVIRYELKNGMIDRLSLIYSAEKSMMVADVTETNEFNKNTANIRVWDAYVFYRWDSFMMLSETMPTDYENFNYSDYAIHPCSTSNVIICEQGSPGEVYRGTADDIIGYKNTNGKECSKVVVYERWGEGRTIVIYK